jgi:hypothetical protein
VRTISIADVTAPGVIRGVVSRKVPEKWRRASLTLTGSDEESTYSFFTEKTEAVRVEEVRRFFEKRWDALASRLDSHVEFVHPGGSRCRAGARS